MVLEKEISISQFYSATKGSYFVKNTNLFCIFSFVQKLKAKILTSEINLVNITRNFASFYRVNNWDVLHLNFFLHPVLFYVEQKY